MPILFEPEELREPAYPDQATPHSVGPARVPPEVAGYRLIEHRRIPLGRVSTLGLLSAPLWWALFLLLSRVLGGQGWIAVRLDLVGMVLGLLILLLLVPALHEAVHGLVAGLLGARPSFGVGAGFAYTTFRQPVGRISYLIIALAPLLTLSAPGLLLLRFWDGAPGLTLVFLIGNAAGAVGDLWVAWQLRTVDRNALIIDLADGFAWYEASGSS